MSADRVEDLLLRWEELSERGQAVTPEELCRDCLAPFAQLLPAQQQVPEPFGRHGASHRHFAPQRFVQPEPGRLPAPLDGALGDVE